MRKALITGSAGLVGSEAVSFFREKGFEITGIDNNMRSKLFGTDYQSNIYTSKHDIRDEKTIMRTFENLGPFDVIIHAAAQPSHDWAKKEPLTDFDINARGTLVLLEATRKFSPNAVFIHVSTDKVYGENMRPHNNTILGFMRETETRYDYPTAFTEELGLDFAGQRSLFGCSKTAADIYVQEYGNYFGIKTACFRPGCITGRNHKGAELHGFLAYLTKCIKEGIPYKIFGYGGKQVRDQIHVYDLVNAFWHFYQNPKVAAVYNIGGGPERSVSVLEAIDMIEKETEKKAITEMHEARQGDRVWDVHDVSKFRQDYPEWDYKYSLDEIIKELCEV